MSFTDSGYSKKPPYKKLEDIPVGFAFYNKLRRYEKFFSVFEYYSFLEGDINGRLVRGKNEMIWILAYGSEYTDDYDIDVGVFTAIDKLRQAYMEILAIKADEIIRDGYSCIEQLKIFGFQKVNELIESALWENKISISPKEFGLPGEE